MCTTTSKTAGGKLLQGTRSAAWCSVMASRGGGRRGGGSRGRGLYIFIADSLCHITDTNTILESNYTPIKYVN